MRTVSKIKQAGVTYEHKAEDGSYANTSLGNLASMEGYNISRLRLSYRAKENEDELGK